MNYNKRFFRKTNDKKILHKVKKQWVVLSLAMLTAIGGGAITSQAIHADVTQAPAAPAKAQLSQNPDKDQQAEQSQSDNVVRSNANSSASSNAASASGIKSSDSAISESHGSNSADNQIQKGDSDHLESGSGPQDVQYNQSVNIIGDLIHGDGSPIFQSLYKPIHYPGLPDGFAPTGFKVQINQWMPISYLIPKGYMFITGPHTGTGNSPLYNDSSWIDDGKGDMKGLASQLSGFNNQIFVDASKPNDLKLKIKPWHDQWGDNAVNTHYQLRLWLFGIPVINGHINVKVVRHFLNGAVDTKPINLSPDDTAVKDISNSTYLYSLHNFIKGQPMAPGYGYNGDHYQYNLTDVPNYQALIKQQLDPNYLDDFQEDPYDNLTASGTFGFKGDATPGAQATLSNDTITLNYYQQPVNLNVKYYDKNTGNLLTTSSTVNNQSHTPGDSINNIPGVPSDLAEYYSYNSNQTNSGASAEYNGSDDDISYQMNNNTEQTISVYLTPKLIYKTGDSAHPGTPEGTFVPSGSDHDGKQVFNNGENNQNGANGLANGFVVNGNQIVPYDNGDRIVWVHQTGSIKIVYKDTDENEKTVKTVPTSTEAAGTPFNINSDMNTNGLANYSLDYSYDHGWNTNANNYDTSYPANKTDTEVIYVKHNLKKATPQDHGPVNPSDLTKQITRTIKYQDERGNTVSADVNQSVTFNRSIMVDEVTDQPVGDYSNWTSSDSTWNQVTSPDLSKYGYGTPDKSSVEQINVNPSDSNINVIVKYPDADVAVKPNQPENPGNHINPANNVPYPSGLTANDLNKTVTRVINYQNTRGQAVAPSVTQKASFSRTAVVDKVTGEIVGYSTSGNTNVDTTDPDQAWQTTRNGWTKVVSPNLTSEGYGTPDKTIVDVNTPTANTADQTITVIYGDKTVPIGPDNPHQPNTPINPSDPNGPKWPNGTDKASLQKTVTRTINYLDANNHSKHVASTVTQPVTLNGTVTVDKATGEIVSNPQWSTGNWADKPSPVVNGYTIDRNSPSDIAAQPVDSSSTNQTVNVYYDHNKGSIRVVYKDTDNDDNIIKTISVGTEDTSSPFNISPYMNTAGLTNYRLDNSYDDSWNTRASNYDASYPSNKTDTEVIYVKHNIVETSGPRKTVTRTINYLDKQNGRPLAASVTQSVTLNSTVKVDEVTGKTVDNLQWSTGNWADQQSPTVKDYTIDHSSPKDIAAQLVDSDSSNQTVNVYYNKSNQPNNGGGNHPNKPNTPNTPNKPNTPNTPVNPHHPNGPVNPNKPNTPNTPNKPNTPSNPVNPHHPNGPVNPNKPNTPNTPNKPNKPNVPVSPTNPNRPVNPSHPKNNGGNSNNTNPNNPVKPTNPSNPSNSSYPKTPNMPSKPKNNGGNSPKHNNKSGGKDNRNSGHLNKPATSRKPASPKGSHRSRVPRVPSAGKPGRRSDNHVDSRNSNPENNYRNSGRYNYAEKSNVSNKIIRRRLNQHRDDQLHRLPQTNEPRGYTLLWTAILAGASIVMASLSRWVDKVRRQK